MQEVRLGQEVRCRVTGFTGVAIARTMWLNGCARICVQPKVDKDGKHLEAYTIDEPQLEVLGETNFHGDAEKPLQERTGGPTPNPIRHADPVR